MEKQPIDSLFRNFVEGADPYEAQAEEAKARVWERSRPQHETKMFPLALRWLSAACILLLFGTTILSFLLVREHRQVKGLLTQISLQTSAPVGGPVLQQRKESAISMPAAKVHDTVFIERTVRVFQPVTFTERLRDTVYIDRVTFVDKECPEQVAFRQEKGGQVVAVQPALPVVERELRITSRDTRKAEKKRKFIFWPGGSGNRAGDESGAITLNF